MVTASPPPLCQVAFSVADLARTERWFREGLGFWAADGSRRMMRGRLASDVQGLPRAASTCWWLVDRNEWFQLELFQFERPLARLARPDREACDIGYSRVGVWVADFDAVIDRLTRLGSPPLTGAVGRRGERRVCVRNPDGVFVEIMEDDPLADTGVSSARAQCRARLRSVTISVPDLARSDDFLRSLGLTPSTLALRAPEHEALWGLPGARTRSAVYRAGPVLVEAVQYVEPVGGPRPAGYRICDQGIVNVAFGVRSRREHEDLYRRACDAGARPNRKPLRLPGAGVVYVNDPQQFSVELLQLSARSEKRWGFRAEAVRRRPRADTHAVTQSVRIAAPVRTTWDIVTDHDAMNSWLGVGSVRRTADGFVERDGRGSERVLTLLGSHTIEQVVAFEPPTTYRYRVTKGSPFVCHQGEIRLCNDGDATELTWTIRFRPRVPGSGRVLGLLLSAALRRMLRAGLRPYVEAFVTTSAECASR